MKKVIAAGHICLDITPVLPPRRACASAEEILIPGKLVQTEGVRVHTGGSVANTGLALKLMGNDVSLMGKVGSDAFGALVKRILAGYGAGGLITDPDSATSYSVVLALPGIDRIFLHDPGANDTFAAGDIPEAALREAALFHFGYPTLMKRMYRNGGEELEGLFRRVREAGAASSLDLSAVDPESEAGRADWAAILARVLPLTDFFLPSFEELCFMLDRPRYQARLKQGGDMTAQRGIPEDADRLARRCLDLGCGAVVVKCGLSGMVCRTAGRERISRISPALEMDVLSWADRACVQPCFRADTVLSGTGAGDVSIAAWLTALLRGMDPQKCTRLAAAEGAASVAALDALSGILPPEALEKRIEAGWETVLPAE